MDWPAATPPVPKYHEDHQSSRQPPVGGHHAVGGNPTDARQPMSSGGPMFSTSGSAASIAVAGPTMAMLAPPPLLPPPIHAPAHVHLATAPQYYSPGPRSDEIGGGCNGDAGQVPGSLPRGQYSRDPSRHLRSPHWSPAASVCFSARDGDASKAPAGYDHAAHGSSAPLQRPPPVAGDHPGNLGTGAHLPHPHPYQSPASSRRRLAHDARQLAAPYVPYTREAYAAMPIGRRQGSASAASMSSSSRVSEDAGPVPRLNRQFQSQSSGAGVTCYPPVSQTRSYTSVPMSDSGVFVAATAAAERKREPERPVVCQERDPYAMSPRLLPPPHPQARALEWRAYGASTGGTVDDSAVLAAPTASLRDQQQPGPPAPGPAQRTSALARFDDHPLDTSYSGRDSSRSHPSGVYPDHDPLARQAYPDAPRRLPHPAHPPEFGYRPQHAYSHHDAQYWQPQYDPYTTMPPPPPHLRPLSRTESAKMPPPMSPASTSVSATDVTRPARPHIDQYPPVFQSRDAPATNPSPRASAALAADPCAPHGYYAPQYPPHYHPSDRHLYTQPPYMNPYHAAAPPPPFPTHPHYASEYDTHAYAWHVRPDAPYYPAHAHMYPPDDYYHHMHAGAGPPLPPPPAAPDARYYARGPYPGPEAMDHGYPAPDAFAYAQAHAEGPGGAGIAGDVRGGLGWRAARAAAASGRTGRGAARTARGVSGFGAGAERDEQEEAAESDDEEEEEEDELEEEEEREGASGRGECAEQARGDNEPGDAAEQKRRNYFVFSKVAYELMVRAIRVDRGLDELPEGMQATQGTQHALEVAHWVCGLRRKKWTRLKARLDMDEAQPFFRSLTWKKCTMQIIPREDWPDLIRQAHELTDEIGNVTHLSLKQTFRRLRSLCQTRRSRCGISKEACAEYLPQCSCSERKRQRAAVLESMEARCANK